MTDGFWGNYLTGMYYPIDDHELWIRRSNHAKMLGIADTVAAQFANYPTREELLLFLFHNAPVMRWRCHGESVTFEFDSEHWDAPLRLIQKWGIQYGGPFLHLKIVNFHSMEIKTVLWKDFRKLQKEYIP